MIVTWTPHAWEEYQYWARTNQSILDKINALIEDIQRNPFRGLGKPEPLKRNLSGWWSRRIDREHRLVYRVKGRKIEISHCRYHY